MSVNKAILVGNVCADPTVKHLDGGMTVASFSLATNERGYKLQNGTEVPPRTEFHNIVAWRSLGEICEKYIKKGSQIYVDGKITTRKWEKDGVTRYTTEIIAESIELLGRKPESVSSENPNSSNTAQKPDFSTSDETGDGLPF